MDFDLESLVHLEQSFFDAAYTDGHVHGRTHGLIEGRALGREKGYELWEEIGFYEGFAKFWEAVSRKERNNESMSESRAESHIRHLLDLVAQFPRTNPSAEPASAEDTGDTQLDIMALLSKIRARYKALCATLGVRPRLRAAAAAGVQEGTRDPAEVSAGKNIWKLNERQAGSMEMSF